MDVHSKKALIKKTVKNFVKKILYSFDYPWIFSEVRLFDELAFNKSRFKVYSRLAKSGEKTRQFYRPYDGSNAVTLEDISASDIDDCLVRSQKYGCSYLENFLSDEEFCVVARHFEELEQAHQRAGIPAGKIGAGVSVVTGAIEGKVSAIFVEKLNRAVNNALNIRFSPSRRSMTSQVLQNISKDLDDPNTELHIDRFIPCLKFFYFPESVDSDQSPYGFVPYSHICSDDYSDSVIEGMKRYHDERTRPFSIQNPTTAAEVEITIPGNTLVAAYTNGLHRRVPFTSEKEFGMTRKSMRFDFYSSFNKLSLLKGLF